MSDSTSPSGTAVSLPVNGKPRTTWGEILVCGMILALALYVFLFAALLADALFFNRNLVIKPIENTSKALSHVIKVIYYPEIVLLKFFRVIPG